MSESKCCPTCGAKMVKYKHRLNKGLCNALLKLYNYGGIAPLDKLNLSKSEYCNFQKLKYWDFIRKAELPEGHKGGVWEITSRGNSFVQGYERPELVVTYRGQFSKWEGKLISMKDVIGEYDYRPWYADVAQGIGNDNQSEMKL